MASDRQIKANQENARLSTGPKTLEGKTRSSLNAVRHGLLARDAVLPQEDRATYLELLAALQAEYQPDGPTHTFLVEQLASAQWRMQRFRRVETGLVVAEFERTKRTEYCEDPVKHEDADYTTPTEHYDEATRLLGLVFVQNCRGDAFTKLARYGTMLNREYYRALKALQDCPRPTPPAPARTAPRPQPIDEANPIPPAPEPVPLGIPRDPDAAGGRGTLI
jgi:hypothetical protein